LTPLLADVLELGPDGPGPNQDGILPMRLAPSASYTPWLNLPSPEQLRQSLARGVADTIQRYAQGTSGAAATRANAYDLRRAGWQALCPVRRDAIVLDFGCGLGAVSRSLARNCRGVIGIDACYERLMINAAINREESYGNIQLVYGDHETLAALRPGSIDGIVLNGVLEWVPEYVGGRPEDAQLSFLAACRRALKDAGWLYIGIENRWGFRYFLGRRDEHTGLLGSSLLPRSLASLYSRAVRGRPYRTFTYGPRALGGLLARAGFNHVQPYAPLPDYRDFEVIVPLDGEPVRAHASRHLGITKRWKRRLLESRQVFRRVVPSLGYVATPDGCGPRPWLEDLESPASHVYVKYDQASVWHGKERWQVRDVALSMEAAAKLERMEQLAAELGDQPGCPAVLKGFRVHRSDSYTWATRSYVDGRVLDTLPPPERESHIDGVLKRLRETHQLGAFVSGQPMALVEIFDQWAPNAARDLPADLLERLRGLMGALQERCSARVLMHGDCSVKNIVLSARGIELIDWEWCRLVDFEGYDVLKLVWHDREDPSRPEGRSPDVDSYFEDASARQRHEQVHGDAAWERSVMTYWLLRIARSVGRHRHGGMPPGWPEQHVHPVLASLERRPVPPASARHLAVR
jgi:SAM-dependent methyltransferase